MPRHNRIERTYECQYCDQKYSYQSGLCTHLKHKHPDIYEQKMAKKGIRRSIATLKHNDPPISLECINDKHKMKDIIAHSETLKRSLLNGKFSKDWIAVLVALLKGNMRIQNGTVYIESHSFPVSDEIFKPIIENYINALDEYILENIKSRDDHIVKGIYPVSQIIQTLPEKIHYHVQEFRKLSEQNLKN